MTKRGGNFFVDAHLFGGKKGVHSRLGEADYSVIDFTAQRGERKEGKRKKKITFRDSILFGGRGKERKDPWLQIRRGWVTKE